jgi:hypothetical protein
MDIDVSEDHATSTQGLKFVGRWIDSLTQLSHKEGGHSDPGEKQVRSGPDLANEKGRQQNGLKQGREIAFLRRNNM